MCNHGWFAAVYVFKVVMHTTLPKLQVFKFRKKKSKANYTVQMIHCGWNIIQSIPHTHTHTDLRLLIRQMVEQAGFIQHKLVVLCFSHTFFIGGDNHTHKNKTHLFSEHNLTHTHTKVEEIVLWCLWLRTHCHDCPVPYRVTAGLEKRAIFP